MKDLNAILEKAYIGFCQNPQNKTLKSFGSEKEGDEYGAVLIQINDSDETPVFYLVNSGQIGKGFTDYYEFEFFETEDAALVYYLYLESTTERYVVEYDGT